MDNRDWFFHAFQKAAFDKFQIPLVMARIPKQFRDQLRKMVAEHNFKYPDDQTFAATIATKILCEYLEKVGAEK